MRKFKLHKIYKGKFIYGDSPAEALQNAKIISRADKSFNIAEPTIPQSDLEIYTILGTEETNRVKECSGGVQKPILRVIAHTNEGVKAFDMIEETVNIIRHNAATV